MRRLSFFLILAFLAGCDRRIVKDDPPPKKDDQPVPPKSKG